MSAGGNFGAFAIGTLCFVGIFVVNVLPLWRINSQVASEQFLMNNDIFEGVWWRCAQTRPGFVQCDNYDAAIIALPADIQACRALICIATMAAFSGMIISLLGLDCTTMIEAETKPKYMASLVAGLMFLTAGLTCCGSVSWYAWRVTMEFHNPLYQQREFKYQYGACLYIGWVSTLLALVAGVILTMGSCGSLKSYNDRGDYSPYNYKPPASKPKKTENNTEYV